MKKKELLKRVEDNPYAMIIMNYPNGDMVGHTGNFESARTAIETVDECVGKVVDRLLELDAHILITADHGNSEQMESYETGMTKTSHTTYPVELIYIAKDAHSRKLKSGGKLADIALTILDLMSLEPPKDMTADNLFEY